jgi:uncharacterized paraquat-inducible protein A
VVTGASAGLLNPVVSTAEDLVALVLTLVSILVPLLTGFLVGALCVGIVWLVHVRSRRSAQPG